MLTGDNERTARRLPRRLESTGHRSSPSSKKSRVIQDLQAEGKSVIMVGDGINDAPALATADIGIAMGSRTDIAMESADIVVPVNGCRALEVVVTRLRPSRRKLFWAFIYNVLAIPVAMEALCLFGGALKPVLAGLL